MSMEKPASSFHRFMISLLATFSTVLGCGVIPAGQAVTKDFTITDFTLPVAMVYSTAADVQARVPGIAATKEGAKGLVTRLVKQTVLDFLDSQGRSALLPGPVISAILSQLTVTITYEPMECKKVIFHILEMVPDGIEALNYCVIASNTVTGICMKPRRMRLFCALLTGENVVPVPVTYTSISGTLSTTNLIMANWPNTMWQSVVDRAIRVLASGPFGLHFSSVSATIGGN